MNKIKKIRNVVDKLDEMTIDYPNNTNGEIVNVQDFGARKGKEFCNYVAFKEALDYCKRNRASKIIVPKGKYYFRNLPKEENCFLNFKGQSDIIFDGQNSEFIFEKVASYIYLKNTNKVILKNFKMDWNWGKSPLASVGVVTNVAEDGSFFDCKFPSYDEIPSYFELKIIGPFDPINFSPGVTGGIEFRPYENLYLNQSDNIDIDNKMNDLVRELSNIIKSMEKVEKNVMRFYSVNPKWVIKRICIGQVYNFRHYEYDTVAVYMHSSSHLSFDNVIIYSCPGSGYVGSGDLHHFQFKNCKVIKRPGTDRSISTTADCFHIANSQGYFKIENCEFSHAGDDCINLHDNTSMGFVKLDSHSIAVQRVMPDRNLFAVGDLIEFRNSDFSPTYFKSKLKYVKYVTNNNSCVLEFEEPLPDNIKCDSIIFNCRFKTENYIIRNNKFHTNRARGILIHGSNGLIEGNHFYNIQGAAIQIEAGAEIRWAEGKGISNLIVRGNVIESCDVNKWVMAVVYMGVYLPNGRTKYPIFNGIIFEENSIINCPRLAWFVSSCSNVFIHNNVIINSNTQPLNGRIYGSSQQESSIYGEYYEGTIEVTHSQDVIIKDNKRVEYIQTCSNGIYKDEKTTENIMIEGNKGFE